MLLIDCGGNIFTRIMEKNLLDGVKDLHIILTHLHGDHVGSLGTLIDHSFWDLGMSPTIYFPIEEDIKTLLRIQGILLEPSARNGTKQAQCVIHERRFISIDLFSCRLDHAFHVFPLANKSFGLHMVLDEKLIYYSGDTRHINCLDFLLDGHYDEVYHDVTTWEYSPVHAPYGLLLKTIPVAFRQKVYLMHLDKDFDYERAKADGFNVVECI